MKELKSKKTGRIQIISDEEYAKMVNKNPELVKRFVVTDLSPRSAIPTIKPQIKKTKNDG